MHDFLSKHLQFSMCKVKVLVCCSPAGHNWNLLYLASTEPPESKGGDRQVVLNWLLSKLSSHFNILFFLMFGELIWKSIFCLI